MAHDVDCTHVITDLYMHLLYCNKVKMSYQAKCLRLKILSEHTHTHVHIHAAY